MERQRSHHGSSRTTTEERTENPDAVAAAAAARRLARRAAYMRQYRASQSQDRLSQTKAQHALRQRLRRQSQDTAQETERRRQQQQQQLSTRDRYATTTTTDRLIGNNNNNHPDYEEDRHPNNYPEIIRRDSAEARSALSWLQLKGDEDQRPRKLEQVSSGLKGDFLLPPQIHPFDKMDCVGLPPGWKREEVVRKSGLSAGKTDVYYYSPDGKKIRSKPQLARHIGDVIDLSAFDFRTGRIIHSALRKRMRHDSSLALPIRQTASIFKQPVTVIRTRPESRPKTDLKHGPQEQPKQLFWEKRLRGVQPRDVNDDPFVPLELPLNMQGMDSKGIGPDLTTENILQSIAAALHVSNIPVTGQNSSKSIQKNPGVNMDANQPKMQYMMVSDNDVRRQEHKVLDARRKLQAALVGVS